MSKSLNLLEIESDPTNKKALLNQGVSLTPRLNQNSETNSPFSLKATSHFYTYLLVHVTHKNDLRSDCQNSPKATHHSDYVLRVNKNTENLR